VRGASAISSSESFWSTDGELEPILPASPLPNPIGKYRIFKPDGCGLGGLLCGTVARPDLEVEIAFSAAPGRRTTC